jgi:hypothetical protein
MQAFILMSACILKLTDEGWTLAGPPPPSFEAIQVGQPPQDGAFRGRVMPAPSRPGRGLSPSATPAAARFDRMEAAVQGLAGAGNLRINPPRRL